MAEFKLVYKKTKRGSIVKIRDYSTASDQTSLSPATAQAGEDTRFQYPKHLTPDQVKAGIESGRLLTGKFQASRENSLEGYVSVDIEREDVHVLLQGRESLNRAIHDDEVVIELLPESEWRTKSDLVLLPEVSVETEGIEDDVVKAASKLQMLQKSNHIKPTGRVVAIAKRVWRQYTGVLRRHQAALGRSLTMTRCLFVPSDRRVPIIRIETRQYESLKDQRLVVAMDSWPRASRYPQGHYVKSLGRIGDKDTENQVLLLEHDVPHLKFTDAVLSCLPSEGSNWKVPEEEVRNRLDLRSVNICSVDPPGCTDIDDALHYADLDQDTCEVGVHIADVSYFVKPGTALDQEAANRGTTVYLSDRRIDMIPELLSSNLCSLIQHRDRLAFSAIWRMRKSSAQVLDVQFTRSIINSKASLTYEQAQAMIDDRANNSPLHQSLRGLSSLAKKLKKTRTDRGALVLARADEIRFVETESETHERDASLEIQHKRLVETNSMVEEMMLLANMAVANKLLQVYPQQALLRRHPKPSRQNFDDLVESARVEGFEIRPETGKSLSESLDLAKLAQNDFFNLMLRMIATRCMTPAAYFCSGQMDPEVTSFTHFGLAADLYTHFTSPIRRYADLLVHRLLAGAIGSCQIDRTLDDSNRIQLMCDQINYRHRMAQLASRASARLHTVLYIKSKRELVEEAYVFFVRQNAIQILIPRIAFEYTYFLQPADEWQYDVVERCQRNTVRKLLVKQFCKLKVLVRIASKDDMRFSDKIEVRVLDPPLDTPAPLTDVEALGDASDNQDDLMLTSDSVVIDDEKGMQLVDGAPLEPIIAYHGNLKKQIRFDEKGGSNASNPVVVLPGDSLEKYVSKESAMLGPGLVRSEGTVVACKSGILKMRNNNLFWVDCHQKRYVASKGECVIGIVRSKASLHCRVDINSADLATLSLLAFEGANKRNKPSLSVGDVVYAKVLSASKHIETELVCVNSNGKRDGLGLIGDKGGTMTGVSIDTVRILLSPHCDLLERLGQMYRYEIALGMNGRVWVNSDEAATVVRVVSELHKFDLE